MRSVDITAYLAAVYDYSSATLKLPGGYFIAHLRLMGEILTLFPGLKMVQGATSKVTVNGYTSEAREVAQWAG